MTLLRSRSVNNINDEEPEVLFSGYVKKMSRNFRIWQQRVLTLNSHGDIYITKISGKDPITFSSFSPQDKLRKQKTPINISQPELVARQGHISDGKWPTKLDLRQSLVLECATTKFLFFPSIRAAEALRTQLQILQWRTDAQLELEASSLVVKRRDAIKKRENTILKRNDIPVKQNSVQAVLDMKELGKFAENVKSQLIEKSVAIKCQEEGDNPISCELSLDFEVRENLVSCKVSHSLEDLTQIDKLPSKASSLLRLLKNSDCDFKPKPKPILKSSKQEYFCRQQKSKKKVQFDSGQTFRISTSANPRAVQLNWQNVILPNFYQHVRKHSFDVIYIN